MSNQERPLPKPPNKAFGRKNNFEEQEEQGSLLADRMAAAAAEGKLDEFLKQEMPDNEYSRNLATMMMGMTGMMPSGRPEPAPQNKIGAHAEQGDEEKDGPDAEVPDDVRSAVMGGDVQSVMDLLRREHQKRNPEATAPQTADQQSTPAEQPAIDKEIIEALVRIASENSVTVDWIILRAIKVYVQEYLKTGNL